MVTSVMGCKLLGVLSDSNAVRHDEGTKACEVLTCTPDDNACSDDANGLLYVTHQYDGKVV